MADSPRTAVMKATLKARVVPTLRVLGFRGSFPHFARPRPDRIDLLAFQFSLYGPTLYVEIGTCEPEGVTYLDGRHVPPEQVRTRHVWPRHRLCPSAPLEDGCGFEFGSEAESALGSDVYERHAAEILELVEAEAESWWAAPIDPLRHDPNELAS